MLSGGEDYELLFTIDQSEFEKVRNLPKAFGDRAHGRRRNRENIGNEKRSGGSVEGPRLGRHQEIE